jgi:hypothetical protein
MALLWLEKGFPPHWCRIINIPSSNEGNFENDGHGLISLFLYKLWQRLPDGEEWLRKHWRDIELAGDWIIWQFENPDKSGATDVLLTDSECAGGYGGAQCFLRDGGEHRGKGEGENLEGKGKEDEGSD